jgi:hypothetical protein
MHLPAPKLELLGKGVCERGVSLCGCQVGVEDNFFVYLSCVFITNRRD